MKQYLAFDLGGTFIKYALMNENAEILEQGKVPAATDSLEGCHHLLQKILVSSNLRLGSIHICVDSCKLLRMSLKSRFLQAGCYGSVTLVKILTTTPERTLFSSLTC